MLRACYHAHVDVTLMLLHVVRKSLRACAHEVECRCVPPYMRATRDVDDLVRAEGVSKFARRGSMGCDKLRARVFGPLEERKRRRCAKAGFARLEEV